MPKMPTASVVVTSYNYEKYILKTLESIKSQTYGNFEIIIVDDFSSDKSVEICEKFIAENQDLKITLLKNDKNRGQLYSMLRGLKLAQGEFVSFLDSDDVLFPEFLEKHIRVHLETSVAFTSCQIAEIGENDELHTLHSVSSPHSDLESLFAKEKVEYKKLGRKRFGGWYWSPNSSAMFRRSAIEFMADYKNTDKWRICPDKFLFNLANLIGGSIIIYTPLVYYRRHKGNSGDCTLVTGDKRLHSDRQTVVNVKNNIKIRPETIKFLWQEREILGLRNTLSFILRVII